MLRSLLNLAALSAAAGLATPSFAQPVEPGCAIAIDDLGAFVGDLDRILGAEGGRSGYGALEGDLSPEGIRQRLAALSREQRKDLAGKLLGIAMDEELGPGCDRARIRYNAAMLLEAILRAGLEDRGTSAADRAYFVEALLAAAEAEKDPAARRQLAINLDRLNTPLGRTLDTEQKRRVAALTEEFLPTSPHYPTVFGADGKKTVVNVVVHTANQENRFRYYRSAFAGSKIEERGGDLFIEHAVTPDDPTGRYEPVTFRIHVKDEHRGDSSNFEIFDRMDSDDPAIELFNFHSQYGSNLSKSIREGAVNPGSRKIFFLGNCKSVVNMSRVQASYPALGSIYTIDSQYMVDTPATLRQLLDQLPNRPTWEQINESMKWADLLQHENYLMPDDRRRLAYLDTDFDGIPDAQDTGVDCGLVEPPQVHDDFGPREPVADASRLNGEKLLYAVHAANGILGYSDLVKELDGTLVAGGYTPADPAGARFTFTKMPGGKIRVQLNAAYSHLSDTALTAAILREGTLFARNGTREPSLDEKILAYELGVKLLDAWGNQAGTEAYEGFQKAYGLGKSISLWDAASRIDHDRGVTRATIDYIKSRLGGT